MLNHSTDSLHISDSLYFFYVMFPWVFVVLNKINRNYIHYIFLESTDTLYILHYFLS